MSISLPISFPGSEQIVSAQEVSAGLDKMATEIQPQIDSAECTLLGVMLGGVYPLMQLAARLHGDFLLDYCHATRYQGNTTGSELRWLCKPRLPMQGRTVIIVDDILDAGSTISAITDLCREQGAGQVLTAVLVVKEFPGEDSRCPPDFSSGIRVPDRYVFGCGMDYQERWRHLNAIYALAEQEIR